MPARDPSCIFCKIVAGELPSMKFLETEHALAFLDIAPLADSHVLLISKQHYARLNELPAAELAEITRHLPRLSRAVQAVSGCDAQNILQNNGAIAGQAVDHLHFHIIPRREGDGLGYRWLPKKYEPGRAEQLHEQLLQSLKPAE